MKTGEGKIVGFGCYNSEEDFLKTSRELKKMWDDFIKSFDGLKPSNFISLLTSSLAVSATLIIFCKYNPLKNIY